MLLIIGTLLPAVAKASVLTDIVANAFSAIRGNVAEADTTPSGSGNVQNMQLLKGTLNPALAADTGGGDVTYIDGSAVVADDGLSGTYVRPANSTISTYVVRQGDTLSGIAALFDVTPNTILWANDLPKGTALKPGQTLTILPVTGVKYTVRNGDTLASIAKKFDGDAQGIASYNGIDDGALAAGTVLIVPDGEIPDAPAAPIKHVATNSGSAVGGAKTQTTASVGYFSSPLQHYIRTQGIHGYNGVDLADPSGTPIYAAADGDVIVSKEGGYNGGYGSYVVILHSNGMQTLYAHQSKVVAAAGAHVTKGQLIGYVGNTGKVSGPTGYHLHFEVRGGTNFMAYTPRQM